MVTVGFILAILGVILYVVGAIVAYKDRHRA